ncbi:MAG: hypothetical protein ACKOXB_03515 [Flavobacteriales bacterium]
MSGKERYQMQQTILTNEKRIDVFLKVIIALLIITGLSYFSLPFLSRKIVSLIEMMGVRGGLYSFAVKLRQGAVYNAAHYPFMGYGTDLLGFAHLMFALLLVGPIIDADKNEWVIRFGIMVCTLFIPVVLIMGWIREIPIIWRVMSCLMGATGFLLLFRVFKMVKMNQRLEQDIESLNQKKINPDIRVA